MQPQAGVLAILEAHVEEELEAQADAQARLPARDGLLKRLAEASPAQLGHRVGECADARQHDLRGPSHAIRDRR